MKMIYQIPYIVMKFQKVVLILSILCVSISTQAKVISDTIDLAALDPGTEQTYKVKYNGEMHFTLKNRIPAAKYGITVEFKYQYLPPLTNPYSTEKVKFIPDPCLAAIENSINAFYASINSEKQIPEAILNSVVQYAKDNPLCSISQAEVLRSRLKKLTIQDIPENYPIRNGINISITILRITADKDTAVFKIHFVTEPRGEFDVVYGFTFAPNAFNKGETYYSKAVPDTANLYTITKERNPDFWNLTFIPSIFFRWSPAKYKNSTLSPSFTAGLGSDLNTIQVMLGPSCSYNGNLGIVAGVVFSNHQVLRGEFEEGEVIHENLSSDLLMETVIRPELFFSVTFKFNDNPFKKAE